MDGIGNPGFAIGVFGRFGLALSTPAGGPWRSFVFFIMRSVQTMASTNARSAAIAALTSFKSVATRVNYQTTPLKDVFASNVFNEEAQRERLPKMVFKKLQQTIKK